MKDEAWWRNRITEARASLERNTLLVDSLQTRANALVNDFTARDDPAQRAVIAQERAKTLAELQRVQDAHFLDAQEGRWFSTAGDDPALLMRLKEDYDGAEPAATSVSALNLLTLSHLGVENASASATVERGSCDMRAAKSRTRP